MPTTFQPEIPEKKEYPVLPEDMYQAQISSIEDDERPKYRNPYEKEQVMKFVFTVMEGEFLGVNILCSATPSLFKGSEGLSPSKLYQILSAVNKKPLDDEDLAGINTEDVNALIGQNVRVVVKHYQNSKGETRHKIDSFLPVK